MESSSDNGVLDFISVAKEESLLSANTGFDEEGFDDVFIDNPPSADLESPSEIPVSVRRTSDVIDSIGDVSEYMARAQRHSSSSATGEMISSSAISPPTNIGPGRGRLALESIDLGYSSPGVQLLYPKEITWLRTSANSDADATDAQPIDQDQNNEVSASNKANDGVSNFRPSVSNDTGRVEILPVIKDEDSYNMDHKYRGFAVIINNEHFEVDNLPPRHGTQKDVDELTTVFNKLHFYVTVWNNLDNIQIAQRLKDLAARDHTDNDCLAVALLTHGVGSSHIYSKNAIYSTDTLWNTFTPDNCPTLGGKPKLFFLQACRGKRLDEGFVMSRESTQVDSLAAAYKIPTHSDFLIFYSSYEGYYSFRHPTNGTWFIQSLCTELTRNDLETLDFLTVMTRVSRRVALGYQSHSPESPFMHGLKQIPALHSLLIGSLRFKPKNLRMPDLDFVI